MMHKWCLPELYCTGQWNLARLCWVERKCFWLCKAWQVFIDLYSTALEDTICAALWCYDESFTLQEFWIRFDSAKPGKKCL